MDYLYFYKLLFNNHLITPIWEYELRLIETELKDNKNKNEYLILFSIYFCLIDLGNVVMRLDKEALLKKFMGVIESSRVLGLDYNNYKENEYKEIVDIATSVIGGYLDELWKEEDSSVFGDDKFFIIDGDYLYLKKYYYARCGIVDSISRLFNISFDNKDLIDINSALIEGFKLTSGQIEAVKRGLNSNILVTGGPGTGKTTSILFILLNILKNDFDYQIFLAASSGKASSRMKEAISGGIGSLNEDFKKENKEVIAKIQGMVGGIEEYTIHRLLGYSSSGFRYNKDNQFNEKSIFVIDEASMIDISLFNSLLSAIKRGSRIFILGDKNQLPSVEVGAVFSDLLKMEVLKEKVVELDESKRFTSSTEIYKLAQTINLNKEFEFNEEVFKDPKEFRIEEVKDNKPVYFYRIDNTNKKENVSEIIRIWAKHFYQDVQKDSSNLDPNDLDYLDKLYLYNTYSKILITENEGGYGVKALNYFIKKEIIDKTLITSSNYHYTGEVMMITKNNSMLDLYNGDSGILVTFKGDDNLYFMVKKESKIVMESKKETDKVFKLGGYVFYPMRLIDEEEVELAFCITVHKSQGSDYNNILVLLPTSPHHPLLNREILYTAITRTKGNTYILSNLDRLKEAKETSIERDTNIK